MAKRLLVSAVVACAILIAPSAQRFAAADAAQTPSDVVFGLDLARAGADACNFTFSDSDKAALDRELATRIAEAKLSAEKAQDLAANARKAVADHKAADPQLCAEGGQFFGLVRELFDASADRPPR